jgi:uncharacterized protein YbjT (DUF2867 family)
VPSSATRLAPPPSASRWKFHAALDGVERVFLCTSNGPEQASNETSLVDAAAAAGIRRLVKISADGARIGSPVDFWDTHGRVEEHLRTSGIPSVVLRPTTYLSNLMAHVATIHQLDKIIAPAGEARVAMVDPRDVAAVAAIALTEDGHDGRTYTVTGPAAITHQEIAHALSTVAERVIEYVAVPGEVARDGMVRAGMSLWLAEQIVVLWAELRHRATAPTDVVRNLTGREPRTLADFAHDHAATFRSHDAKERL